MRRWTFVTLIGAMGIMLDQSPGFAQTFLNYRCRDGSEFVLAMYAYDRRAHVQLDGKAVALTRRVSVSGFRYANGGITLRITKTGTTLKRGMRSTECTAS